MSKLVIICQKVDETDDLLGFFVGWLREFAKHFDQVEVITLGKGEYNLPENVCIHSLGKERGAHKWFWLPKMKWLLFRHTRGASAVFCHMSPIFAVIAWPFARLRGAKLVLWYLHRSVTLKLKLALRLVDTLVTADKASLNITSDKIVETGHGIDVERFVVSDRRYDISYRPLHILSVGRLSPIKDFGTLIRAATLLKERGRSVQVRIIGKAVMAADRAYERELRELIAEQGVSDIVELYGFVPYRDMPEQYAWADIVVGGTPKGGLDKAILEGMAAGCVPFTSNEAMRPHLGAYAERLLYAHGDADDLVLRLGGFGAYEAASQSLAASVREHHALERTVGHIAKYL